MTGEFSAGEQIMGSFHSPQIFNMYVKQYLFDVIFYWTNCVVGGGVKQVSGTKCPSSALGGKAGKA